MNEYPNSPYQRVRQLLAEFDRGDITGEELLARLNLLVEKLESWYAQLGKISTNESYPEGAQLVEHSKESLQMIYDGVELLAEYVDTQSPETSERALALMAEASGFLAQILEITASNIKELER